MRSPTPSADFEEDFVDGFSLGDGAVDYFAINVIVDHNVLGGTGFFVGAGDIEGRQLSQEAEDMSRDFQYVSMHATQPRSHSKVSLIAGIATDRSVIDGGWKPLDLS
jgi:hypothetical protein